MMVSVITGQSHESGAGMRWAVALGSIKAFSIPIKPSPTLKLCSLVASFCSSTFHLRHYTSSTDYTFVVCCEFPQNGGKMRLFPLAAALIALPDALGTGIELTERTDAPRQKPAQQEVVVLRTQSRAGVRSRDRSRPRTKTRTKVLLSASRLCR